MDSNLLHAAGSDLSRFATFSAASEDRPQRGTGSGGAKRKRTVETRNGHS